MAINGKALTATGLGIVFIWSGLRGWSVLATLGSVITGKKPDQPVQYPLQITPSLGGNTSGGVVSNATGSTIADIALQYNGHAYRFGGAPGPDGSKPWDCSSFVNYVVGVKAGKAIPGYAAGTYKGTTHGPPTGSWYAWPGLTTVQRSQVQAGDILLWVGHMGIATGRDTMISALNRKVGTKTQYIDSGVGRGPIVRIGRLK